MNRRASLIALANLRLLAGSALRAQHAKGGGASLRDVATGKGLMVGAAAFPEGLQDERYADTLSREFNALTPENAMKWRPIHPEPSRWRFDQADRLVDFAVEHKMRVKGHALLWHEMLPGYVNNLPPEELRRASREHIRTLVGRYKGRVFAWDVVNEALDETGGLRKSVFLEKLGPSYIAEAFQVAHEADPKAMLIYNDYGCEGWGGKSDRQFALLQELRNARVPVHGVGLQMHIAASSPPDTQEVGANINRLASLGLRVNISEMDVRLRDLKTPWPDRLRSQSSIIGDVLAACVRQPAFDGVTFWGFTDAHSWIHERYGEDSPLVFDKDYHSKPAYFATRAALSLAPRS